MPTTPGIKVGARQFTDLVYADDTTFFVPSASDAAECLAVKLQQLVISARYACFMGKKL